uniref:Uncharacterized protein n=1 Tax=Naja naja TaxID=35670 RepID=A0A8C6YGS2_NAJNA
MIKMANLIFLKQVNLPHLIDAQKQLLFVPLSEVESKQIILIMASGKIPGLDAFPIQEFYQLHLTRLILQLYQRSHSGKDHTPSANYHPILLINIDTKILTAVLANITSDIVCC